MYVLVRIAANAPRLLHGDLQLNGVFISLDIVIQTELLVGGRH